MRKNNSTKKALLSSALSLVVCFVMLMGTTFAWFTDNASTEVSTIQAGNLNVELLDAAGNSLEGQTLKWQKPAGHENDAVLWEPGCTYELQPITIKNGGNLALKYKVEITGINGDAELNNAIEWTISDQALTANRFLKAGEAETLTISGHMKEDADNTYQGMSIDGIAIKVYATQAPEEYDSTRNDYDAAAEYDTTTSSTSPIVTVATVEELKAALIPAVSNEAATVNLTADIALAEGENWTPLTMDSYHGVKSIVINGNGHTISGLNAPLLGACYFGNVAIEINDLTLSNVQFVNKTYNVGSGAFIAYADNCSSVTLSKCQLKDSEISCTEDITGVGGLVGYSSSNLIIKDCTVINTKITGSLSSTGAIAGHVSAGSHTTTISNAKVIGCTITGEKAAKSGYVLGTANDGVTSITTNSECANNKVFNVENSTTIYGRLAGGTLTVNGTEIH